MTDRAVIRGWIEQLAQSQGSYGRMLETIDNMTPDEAEGFWSGLEVCEFKDIVDFVMFMEE